MTLLTTVQTISDELGLGLGVISQAANSSDDMIRQIVAFVNKAARNASKDSDFTTGIREMLVQINALTGTYTGNTTNGSNDITAVNDVTGIVPDMVVTGLGLPVMARVVRVVGNTITLDQAAISTNVATTLLFAQDFYNLPDDWEQWVSQTAWSRSDRWQLRGPMTPQEYQFYKSGIVVTYPRQRYWVIGRRDKRLQIDPVPGPGDNGKIFAFNYVSKTCVFPAKWKAATSYAANAYCEYNGNIYFTTSGGTSGSNPPLVLSGTQSDGGVTWTFTSEAYDSYRFDTDTALFDEDVIVIGAKAYWLQQKGLIYEPTMKEFNERVMQVASFETNAPMLDLSGGGGVGYIGDWNIPDTGYSNYRA